MGEESEATAGSNISNVPASEEAPEPPDENLYAPEDPEPAVERPSQPMDDEEMLSPEGVFLLNNKIADLITKGQWLVLQGMKQ